MLTDKAKQYDAVLRRQIDDANSAIRDSLRRQLPINIFIQFLAGPANIRRSALGWLLQAIAWVTLVIAPILLLLLMEIQFLPFHNGTITLAHRVVLVADLILVWWLWGTIISGRPVDDRRRRIVSARSALGALCTCVVLFAWTAATFPGEWLEDHLPDWRLFPASDAWGHPIKVSLHDLLFNLPVNNTTRRRNSIFSNTLVLPSFNIYEGLGIDDPEKTKWRDFVFHARDRDLRGRQL